MSRGVSFTPEQDAFIRAHYKVDMPCSAIGERMGKSKSSIIGRAARLGLTDAKDSPLGKYRKPKKAPANSRAMDSPIKKGTKPTRAHGLAVQLGAEKRKRDRPSPRDKPDPLAPVKKLKRTIGGWRPKACQFIEGEPSFDESCKCRKPLLPGSSYCPEHHARCWFGRVEKSQCVTPIDMVVDHCGKKIVGNADGMEIAGKVQIDVFHRHDLGIAAAGGAAFHAKARPERGLADADCGLLADFVEAIAQSDSRRRLAFASRCRSDGRH